MLNGYKTYFGGFGLILLGIGGIVTQKLPLMESIGYICAGLAAVGLRDFGERMKESGEFLKQLVDKK